MPKIVHVVVSDPKAVLPEGTIITNPALLSRAEASRSIVLPLDEDLAPPNSLHPCDGYSIRSWGDGWLFNRNSAERGCPHLLRIFPERQYIHWAARLERVARLPGSASGRFRLVSDTSISGLAGAGLSPIVSPEAIETMELDEFGGYTIRGISRISLVTEGLLPLNLYGVARSAKVIWSAMSLCSGGVGA